MVNFKCVNGGLTLRHEAREDAERMLWCDEALKEQAGMRCRITTACSSYLNGMRARNNR